MTSLPKIFTAFTSVNEDVNTRQFKESGTLLLETDLSVLFVRTVEMRLNDEKR
jgi:hypothetical protein